MLITQKHYASGQSIASWLSGIGSVVAATSTDLVLANSDGTYTHILGSGISYNGATWSGSFTNVQRAMLATPNSPATIGITTEIIYSSTVTVSALTTSLTNAFLEQLMNVPGNTNAGTGTDGNDTFAGSNQPDSFDGKGGVDVVDYTFATTAVSVDLSGTFTAAGAALGDVLTSIEGIVGTALADTLRGSSGNNRLDGAGGNDFIYASTGADTLNGGDGWDRLDMKGLAGNLLVYGGAIGLTQFSGFESYVTGDGNDSIYSQSGTNEVITNGGNDAITLSGSGDKTVLAGAGNDTVSVFAGTGNLTLIMSDGAADALTFVISSGAVETVNMTDIGTATLSGVVSGSISGVEIITSGAMRLNYNGHEGTDEVHASIGADTIYGNGGDDRIYADNGNDLIFGDGDWGLQGGSLGYGSDLVQAGGGDDTMIAANGSDSYSGGSGTDVLSYAQLYDDYGDGEFSIALNGNTVSKSYYEYRSGDTFVETDTIQVAAGDDVEVIIGTAFGDSFTNTAASTRTFDGGGGDDLFVISAANAGDTIHGFGAGGDRVQVSAGARAMVQLAANWTPSTTSSNDGTLTVETNGFTVNLSGLGGHAGVTLINSLTSGAAAMIGTAYADRLESARAGDTLVGGEGDDTYSCAGGTLPTIIDTGASLNDLLISGANATLGGGIEHITLIGSAISATGNAAANRMTGNDLNNIFIGNGGADTMQGGAGSDTYTYTGSEVLIESPYVAPYYDSELGWIRDTARDKVLSFVTFTMTDTGFEDLTLRGTAVNGTGNLQGNAITGNGLANQLRGMGGADTLLGGSGNDTIWGGTAGDRLRGDAGADTLRGDTGNDTLLGGDGADRLEGGTGSNLATGGKGADLFVFADASENTTVTDFTDGVDKLVFSAATGKSAAYLINHAVQQGSDVILHTAAPGVVITLQDATIAELAGDIVIM